MSTNPPLHSINRDAPVPPATPVRGLNLPNSSHGTPQNHGSGTRTHYDDRSGTGNQAQYFRADYKDYILEDLSKHRVYISFENGLRNLLHFPENDGRLKDAITSITKDSKYQKLKTAFFNLCDEPNSEESRLYEPQAELCNHVISLANKFTGSVKSKGQLLHFQTSNRKCFSQGIFDTSSPDIVGKFQSLEDRKPLVWPMIVHVQEMKDSDVALDEGQDSVRVRKPGEKDPASEHRKPTRKSTRKASQGTTSNKRKRSGGKVPPESQTTDSTTQSNSRPTTRTVDSSAIQEARLQCAQYLMEMLELSILRSHAFLTLVDRDNLQLMYADRSAIITTSIINLREYNGEVNFLKMLIAFHYLTPEQWGFLPFVLHSFNKKSSGKTAYHRQKDSATKKVECLRGLELRLRLGSPDGPPISLTLEDIIYHQPGIIGRGTCVVGASCHSVEEWKGQELAVKVSWPSKSRKSEVHLLELARKKAEKPIEGDKHWVLNHLPNILYSEDLGGKRGMPQEKLAVFFEEAESTEGKKFKYEIRVPRISIQERLHKLLTLRSTTDYAQAFYDVFLCHRWLFDYAQTLHRDISLGNIMYRLIDGKPYGVLNDFDLSSLREDVERRVATSVQRTGTPPYMAIDLLRNNCHHLYRHDLESLFYVALLLCSRNKLVSDTDIERLATPPFDEWFNAKSTWCDLAARKIEFFTQTTSLESYIDPSFKDFGPWLEVLFASFQEGFYARNKWLNATHRYGRSQIQAQRPTNPKHVDHLERLKQVRVADSQYTAPKPEILPPPPFDEETMGGYINFDNIFSELSVFGDNILEIRDKSLIN